MPQFHALAFLRLDMWADIIDLLGLTVLLSYDVGFLKPVLGLVMRLRHLKRIKALITNLEENMNRFFRTMHSPFVPEVWNTLIGADASIFMKIFPGRRGEPVPKSGVKVCLVPLSVGGQPAEPWIAIYVADAGTVDATSKPLTSPIHVSDAFNQLEKQIQNFIYGTGFALMAFSSLLSIVHRAIAP